MKCSLALFGWLVLPTLVLAQDNTKRDLHEMHKLHQDSKAYITMLDDPKRDAYQKPHEVITALKLKKTETPVGPPQEMRIERDDLVKEMEKNGFRLDAEHTFLPYQYFLVFKVKQ